jgi:DNA-binding response OmpR family regulator
VTVKKTILVVEGSDLVRKYLTSKLKEHGFEVLEARSGFEGLVKLKNDLPDLVIMEYLLPRINGVELLSEKAKSKSAADIPVILFTAKVDREMIRSVGQYKVTRFFAKPLRIDALMKSISEILGVEISLDTTPCTIDVHVNEGVLFIEAAQGFNREKIELMSYRIEEIMQLYQMQSPGVLVVVTGIAPAELDTKKIASFFRTILHATGVPPKAVKLLTFSDLVKDFISADEKLAGIEIVDNLTQAMDKLLGIKVSEFIPEGHAIVRDDMLSSRGGMAESLQINFEGDKGLTVAVVDDDLVTRELVAAAFSKTGWELAQFENGRQFVDAMEARKFDLVFLDLRMPVMDGFAVLDHMKGADSKVPVIVLSALSERGTVVKAMSYGIKSYMAKPFTPVDIQRKAAEILKTDF